MFLLSYEREKKLLKSRSTVKMNKSLKIKHSYGRFVYQTLFFIVYMCNPN